jgi:N4-gp56 family major capsid protein
MVEVLNETFFGKFMGTGPGSLIRRVDDLTRGPGELIRYDMLEQNLNLGKNGEAQLKGSEQSLSYLQQSLLINQKRQAFAHTRMSQQRTIHTLRLDAMAMLRDFFARIMDRHLMAHLCGETDDSALDVDLDDFNSLVAHDAAHVMDPGTIMTPGIIDDLVAKAKTRTPVIQPVRVEGEDHYVLFLRPEPILSLRKDTDWMAAQQSANIRGRTNPIFSGAIGMWGGVIIHESNFLPIDTVATPDARLGVFCGANSAVVAFGNSFSALDGINRESDSSQGFPFYWAEEIEDYGNEVGIAAGVVMGIERTTYAIGGTPQISFATIQLRTDDPVIP